VKRSLNLRRHRSRERGDGYTEEHAIQEAAVKLTRRTVATALIALAVVPLAAGGAEQTRAPVLKQKAAGFGTILATRGHKALYFWDVEKRDFKVHCTGACAKAWPPLVVKSRAAVPRKIKGISGTFGTIRRPNGALQVTWNRLPVYTYAHERPYQVLCDDVDGWFVVRV
jgi:predicted lipoprotein with Yx(FWY)xxD motif